MTTDCVGNGTPIEIAQEAIVRLAVTVMQTKTAIKPGDLFVIACHESEHLANCALLAARALLTSAGLNTTVEPSGDHGKSLRMPESCGKCGKPFFVSTKMLVFKAVV